MKNTIRLFSLVALFSLLNVQSLWAEDYEFEDDVAEVSEADETALSEDELAQILAEEGLVVDSLPEAASDVAEDSNTQAPVEPVAEVPVEEAPATSTVEAPVEKAPAIPTEEAPAEEAPVTPTVEAPMEASTKEAPVVETSVANPSAEVLAKAKKKSKKAKVGVFVAWSNHNATVSINGKVRGKVKAKMAKRFIVPVGKYKVTLTSGSKSITRKGFMKALKKVSQTFRFSGGKVIKSNKKAKSIKVVKGKKSTKSRKSVKSKKSARVKKSSKTKKSIKSRKSVKSRKNTK